MDGICTLANDRVYDQLVALLNSIEVNGGKDLPVCVYPYDDNTERIKAEIAQRPNVELFDNRDVIERWDNFAKSAWKPHPTAQERWLKSGCADRYYRMGMHHRFIAFDSPFEALLGLVGKMYSRIQSCWRVSGTNHKDTKDTKIDRSYCKLNLSHRT
jgi:hypothetical protein